MTDNFVDVVGYQFERVHTGVIAWLLDTESGSSPLSATERAEIITAIAPGLVDAGKKLKVTATPEYAPRGRKVRIDLHLKITEGASEAHILIECKTDAEVKTEQLERIGEAFRSALPETRFTLVVLAIGAGQFTLKHQLERLKAQEYQVIDLERALEIFSRRVSAEAHWIYKDWIAAMKEERDRGAGIEQAMREAGGIDNLPLGNGGYRRGFSAYYLYYDRLRTHLEKSLGAEWAIYSGVHNPAMGWNERPADAGLRMAGIKLYWEFNGRDLCLKAEVPDDVRTIWGGTRHRLIELCRSCSPRPGKSTSNKSGTWVTAYKWNFPFSGEDTASLARDIVDLISRVSERISGAA